MKTTPTAVTGRVVKRHRHLQPGVHVPSTRLHEGNGVEACREIRSRHPRTACLILTSFADDQALFEAIMAGAAGYVLEQIRANDSSTPCAGWRRHRTCSTRRSPRVCSNGCAESRGG